MATSQIVQKHRSDLKYKLAWDYKDLTFKSKPFTDYLFGDNMKESAVESWKERSISFGVTNKRGKFIPNHLYGQFQSFLGKGRGWNNPNQNLHTSPHHYNTKTSETSTGTRTTKARTITTTRIKTTSSHPGEKARAGAREAEAEAKEVLSSSLCKYSHCRQTASLSSQMV